MYFAFRNCFNCLQKLKLKVALVNFRVETVGLERLKKKTNTQVTFQITMLRIHVCVCVHSLSCIWFFATPWTVAHWVLLFMEFFRPSFMPFPAPGDLPDPGTEPTSPAPPARQAGSLPPCHLGSIHSVSC